MSTYNDPATGPTPPQWGPPAPPTRKDRGGLALLLGILSLFLFGLIAGIPAIVLGFRSPSGKGKVGGVLGIIGCVGSLVAIVAVAAAGGSSNATPAAATKAATTSHPSGKHSASSAPAQAPAVTTEDALGVGDAANDGKFSFVVHGVKCDVARVGGEYFGYDAQGQYCLVDLTVTNIGDEPQTLFSANQKAFVGEREYSTDDAATLVASKGGSSPWIKEINPGNGIRGLLVFDIPPGETIDRLELHDSAFSGGVVVTIQ